MCDTLWLYGGSLWERWEMDCQLLAIACPQITTRIMHHECTSNHILTLDHLFRGLVNPCYHALSGLRTSRAIVLAWCHGIVYWIFESVVSWEKASSWRLDGCYIMTAGHYNPSDELCTSLTNLLYFVLLYSRIGLWCINVRRRKIISALDQSWSLNGKELDNVGEIS